MLKKMVFVAATLLIANSAWALSAGDVKPETGVTWETDGTYGEVKGEPWSWPATFNSEPICVIPVRMDVGFWIRVTNCSDRVLKLKQNSIHSYSGSVDITIQCNVSIVLSVSFSKTNSNLSYDSSSAGITPGTLDAPGGTATVSLSLSGAKLNALQGGATCVDIGTITVKVRPNVNPNLAGGCSN